MGFQRWGRVIRCVLLSVLSVCVCEICGGSIGRETMLAGSQRRVGKGNKVYSGEQEKDTC